MISTSCVRVLAVLLCAVSYPASAQTAGGPLSRIVGPALLAWSSPAMDIVNIVDTDVALNQSSVVGVFYSASWCNPCKQFIPVLEEFYQRMNQKGRERFDIVWVSVNRDETEEEFFHYFRSMPWFAVPQAQIPQTLENTAERFQLTGIPYLVLLNAKDGSIITLEGREKILNDKYGVEFPWRSRSLMNMFPSALRTRTSGLLTDLRANLARTLHPLNILNVSKNVVLRALRLTMRVVQSIYSYLMREKGVNPVYR